MVFQSSHGGHQDHCRGLQPRFAAFDVDEFFSAQVSAKTSFGDHIVGQFHGGGSGDHRVAAVRDVGKRAAMDKGQVVFQGLRDIGGQSVFEQSGHRAMRLQIAGKHWSALGVVSHNDATQAGLQVSQAGGQAKNRHHFRGHHDVKTILAWHAVGGAAQAHHHLAQSAVVHVHHPLPYDAAGVYLEGVAMVNMVVEHGRQQVVRQSNRTKVTGEMKVDVFHGHDLRHAATGGAALHAKHGP